MIIMGVDHFDWYTSDMMLEAERIKRNCEVSSHCLS